MPTTEETLAALRREMRPQLETAMESVLAKTRDVLEEAEQQRTIALAEVAKVRAQGLAEVAKERTEGLAEVAAQRAKLHREIEAMQRHQATQQGRVELNIGGYCFQTSVQTLRRVPHTFFDAYFSGRYAQDVCNDGSIFVDRDGEHFGHVLEYMRDGHVSVAEPGALPSVSLLRALKREFGFYCIELYGELAAEPNQPEMVYVVGGYRAGVRLSSMERYDASSGQWSVAAAMRTGRDEFGTCVLSGEIYVTGGVTDGRYNLSTVEKYSISSDTWSTMAPMPAARAGHATVAIGMAMYVLGGDGSDGHAIVTASVLKYDCAQGNWSQVAPMPAARSSFASCAVGCDIYIFGGNNSGTHSSVFKFDTEANEWSTLPPMPHACRNHSACVLGGLVFITGAGNTGREVLRFDPMSHVWSTLGPTIIDRKCGTSFVVDGCLHVAGSISPTVATSVERYDASRNTWIAVGNMLEERRDCCAVTMGAGGPAGEQDPFDALIHKACCRHP
jgi:hypothetical protein